jgi:hypothetical protein
MRANHDLAVPDLTQWVLEGTFPIIRAASDGRRNTIQCVESTMLPREKVICLAVLGQNLARVVFRLI